ncbi:MAG: PaaI family thioesterase [Candidatus Heimdallarchaeota archaeon]|nr:PaaI family thioesterase [Candidatus Heimdallarchaeota archaeon]MDH5646648.1 PaaI family thioesterase [Candidatus Heimdallarchaeota archaeon]
MDQDHFTKLENMYHKHPFNEFVKAKISIAQGEARILINIEEKFHHAANAVHGALYFKALDDVTFFAVNSLIEGNLFVTSNFNLNFLRPIAQGTITGVGKVVYKSKNQCIAEGVLYNDENKEIARGSGTFTRSSLSFPYQDS